MTEKKNDHDELITSIAQHVTARVMQNVNEIDKRVSLWMAKNLQSIVMLGLGIKTSAWGDLEIIGSDSCSSALVTYIKNVAINKARERAPAVIKKIMEHRISQVTPSEKAKFQNMFMREFRDAYDREMRSLVSDALNADKSELSARIDALPKEIEVMFKAMLKPQMTSLIASITRDETNDR